MTAPTLRMLRYARAWILGPDELVEDDIELDRDGTTVPATLIRPRTARWRLPGWIVLHGITRPGRAHGQLMRFTRAIASTGAVAIVPDVPEWRELSLSPHLSAPTVRAALAGLRDSALALDAPVGVIGVSFGAPQAIAAAGTPGLQDEIATAVGFGGYGHLESTFEFMLTGRHGWGGEEHTLRPDPYGRWVVGANYLTSVPGREDSGDVARALRVLAETAGDAQLPSWHPAYDSLIDRLRDDIDESRQSLFDLFAPRSDAGAVLPDARPREESQALAEELASVGRRTDPLIDPREALGQVTRPVHVIHGRGDALIPFSQAYRLRDFLPDSGGHRVTVTRIFGHSGQDALSIRHAVKEVPAFAVALTRLFAESG